MISGKSNLLNGLDMIRIEAIAKFCDARCDLPDCQQVWIHYRIEDIADLVELDTLFAAVGESLVMLPTGWESAERAKNTYPSIEENTEGMRKKIR